MGEKRIFIERLLKENKAISHIYFNNEFDLTCSINEVIKLLKDNGSFTHVGFINFGFKDKDIFVLIDFLCSNSSVSTLDLSRNKITSKGKAMLDEVLASRSTECKLILDDNAIMDEAAIGSLRKKIAQTRTVDFSDNIGDEEQFISVVLDAIKEKKVDTVMLGNTWEDLKFKEDFILRMAKENLDVQNLICPAFEYVDAICELIKLNTHVQKIDFSNAYLWNGEVEKIANVLHFNSTLKKLILSGNQIGDDGAKALHKALQYNDTLIDLDLTCNHPEDCEDEVEKISKTSFNQIAKKLRLNKFREELGTIPVVSDDEFCVYIDTIDRICENIKLLKSETADSYSVMEVIKKDVHELKGVFDKLDLQSKKCFETYKYYEAVMNSLKEKYKAKGTNKKYIEKIYTQVLEEFNIRLF